MRRRSIKPILKVNALHNNCNILSNILAVNHRVNKGKLIMTFQDDFVTYKILITLYSRTLKKQPKYIVRNWLINTHTTIIS